MGKEGGEGVISLDCQGHAILLLRTHPNAFIQVVNTKKAP